MWADKALLQLSSSATYSRDDIFQTLTKEKPNLSESTFRWTLYGLLKNQKIFKIDYDAYVVKQEKILPEYKPYYSDKAKELEQILIERFPKVKFVIFESTLLNEFLNHQIAQNTIYVQIEKDISSYIFDNLQEEYEGEILYKPDKKIFDRYWRRGCIVVSNLISQTPLSQNSSHEITLEKMLVDIITEKIISSTFSPSETSFIYENALKSYYVDKRKMNRYAGRRGATALVKRYLEEVN